MAVRVCFSLLVAIVIVWISLSLPTIASGQDVINDSVIITPSKSASCDPSDQDDIEFTCEYTGPGLSDVDVSQVQWFLNSSNVTTSNTSSGVVVMGHTLTLSCAEHLNNIEIRCAISGQQSNTPTILTINRQQYISIGTVAGSVCGGAVFVVLVCIVIGAVVYALIYAPRKHKQPKLSVEAVDYMRRNKERTEQEMREREQARKIVERYLSEDDCKYEKEESVQASVRQMNKTKEGEDEEKFQLGDIGGRLQKYWFRVQRKAKEGEQEQEEPQKLILTIAPVSKRCALPLNDLKIKATLDKLCSAIADKKHPYVHSVYTIAYILQTGHVIVVQEKYPCGSLRDELHGGPPANGWMDYRQDFTPISSPDASIENPVAYYGWQILQGLKFLYDQGFPPLGHAHTGNIYIHVEKEGRKVCKVGGYDNTLLGYSSLLMKQLREVGQQKQSNGKQEEVPAAATREQKDGKATGEQKDGQATGEQKDGQATGEQNDGQATGEQKDGQATGEQTEGVAIVKQEERPPQKEGAATKEQVKPVDLKWIDVIQFGHVLYEMAEGKCFSTPLPVHSDYEGSSVEEILDYIFEMVKKNKDISHKEALKKIMKHKYFKSCSRKEKLLSSSWWSFLHGDVRGLLERVREGEPVQQKIVSDDHSSSGCETPSSDDTLIIPVPSPDITTAQPVSIVIEN